MLGDGKQGQLGLVRVKEAVTKVNIRTVREARPRREKEERERERLSQSPSRIRYIRSSTPGAKDFSFLQRAKFTYTGEFFLLGRDSCLIVRCPMRSENV